MTEEKKKREQKLKDGKIIEIKKKSEKKYSDMKPKEMAVIFNQYLDSKSNNWKVMNIQYWILFFLDEEISKNYRCRKDVYYNTIMEWLRPVKQSINKL